MLVTIGELKKAIENLCDSALVYHYEDKGFRMGIDVFFIRSSRYAGEPSCGVDGIFFANPDRG